RGSQEHYRQPGGKGSDYLQKRQIKVTDKDSSLGRLRRPFSLPGKGCITLSWWRNQQLKKSCSSRKHAALSKSRRASCFRTSPHWKQLLSAVLAGACWRNPFAPIAICRRSRARPAMALPLSPP